MAGIAGYCLRRIGQHGFMEALTTPGDILIVCLTGLMEDAPRAFVVEQGFSIRR